VNFSPQKISFSPRFLIFAQNMPRTLDKSSGDYTANYLILKKAMTRNSSGKTGRLRTISGQLGPNRELPPVQGN
jgi:hypothetical protein